MREGPSWASAAPGGSGRPGACETTVVTTTAVTRGVQERWTVTAGYQVLNVTDSVRVPGRAGAIGYLSIIPCRS